MNHLRTSLASLTLVLAFAAFSASAFAAPIAPENKLDIHPLIGSEWMLEVDHIYTQPVTDDAYTYEVLPLWEPTAATVQSILLQMDGSLKVVFRLENGTTGYVYVESLTDLDKQLRALPAHTPLF